MKYDRNNGLGIPFIGMAPTRRSSASGDNTNPNVVKIIAQQLHNIIPQIVTQVTNNINNANANGRNGNGGGAIALTRWIEMMNSIMDISGCLNNQKVKHATSSLINKALTWWNTQIQASGREDHAIVRANHGAYTDRFHELAKLVPLLVTPESKRIERVLTDEAVRCVTLSKGSTKRKEIVETSNQRGSWNDNKRAKVGKGFMAAVPPGNEYVGSHPKCVKHVAQVNVLRMGNDQRTCYEYGSFDHFRNTCPKLNRAPGQVGNFLTIKEVANGKKVEVDRIICRCKLELGNSLFTIDLIPLDLGVLMLLWGWISCLGIIEIVCHEKVKEYQEKDKIGSKPDKNRKRGEAKKSQKQLQWIKEEKLNKTQKEGPEMQTPTSFNKERREQGLVLSDSLDDNIIPGLPPFSAITPNEPVLSTEEPDNYISMGDEHLDTIPATKSDEFIKSGVENLIPIPKISSGSTTTHPDISLSEYEVFYDDHVKEISSGSPTTHSDSSLYATFIFDFLINPLPPADRSDSYEFTNELIPFISAPEYDCFLFKDEPNLRDFTKDVVEDISLTKEPQVLNTLPPISPFN
nr:hypothetical protein [Tanacetum cinerariifolium]